MAALLGRTYFDANVFIYVIEGPSPFTAAALAVVQRLADEEQVPVTSDYAFAECLVGSRKANSSSIEDAYMRYFDDASSVECHALTRDVLIAAARMAGDSGMRLADTIHVATAMAAGCQSFVTNDRRLKLPAGLSRISILPTPPAGS